MTKDSLSEDKESAGKGLFLDNLKKLIEARLDYDRWIYELLKNLKKNGKQTDEKRKDYDRDQIKWKQDMEEKVKLLEEGYVAIKKLLGIIPNILSAVTKNLEDIAKVLDNSSSPKPVVDLDMDEDTIEIGNGEATLGVAAKRTRASVKKVVAASAKDIPNLRENIKDLYGISNTLANALKNIT